MWELNTLHKALVFLIKFLLLDVLLDTGVSAQKKPRALLISEKPWRSASD